MIDPLEKRRSEILAVVEPFVAAARKKISARVADAHAHAMKVLTQSAIDTPDGQATLRKVDWSVSFDAASERLFELAESLSGPRVGSHKGLIRSAWVAAYGDCFRYYRETLSPEILDPRKTEPTAKMEAKVKTTVLLGYDARTFILPPIDQSISRLKSLLVSLASPNVPSKVRADRLSAWKTATESTLAARAAQAIRTGAFYFDRVAGRDVILPELLHPDPTVRS